jgi:hypothetical protein
VTRDVLVQVFGVAVARLSAQARATSESADFSPGISAKPLRSIKLPRSHELVLVSSASLAGASAWARKRSAQIEASAVTVASWVATATRLSALPPVTHPPHGCRDGADDRALNPGLRVGWKIHELSFRGQRCADPETGPTRRCAADDQQDQGKR